MKSKELGYYLIVAVTFFFHTPTFTQIQLGTAIKGETFKDQFGTAIALSDDGTILAIGAKENDEIASNSGHVRLFKRESGQWTQLGEDIDGFKSSDRLGSAIALSADGLVVACGAPDNGAPKGYVVIRAWDGNAWISKGETVEGIGVGERFGTSVALSADGNRFAAGAIANDDFESNAGQVRIYDWDGNSWIQIGQPINGEAAGDNAGIAVSLSADGNRLAVGANDNSEAGEKAGHVRVFELDDTSAWNQIGTTIFGEGERDESGSKVVLSADGNRVAISAQFNDGTDTWAGHVRVYEWTDNDWIQLGEDLDGEERFDQSGYSLDMGDNGNRIIIGALNNNGNGAQSGHARVYEWADNQWTQVGQDIDGEMPQDLLGFSVAISENGQKVAVGAPINGNAFDENAGYAKIFSLQNYLNATSKWQVVSGDVFDNWYSVAKMKVIGDTLIEQNTYLKILKRFNILRLEMGSQDTIIHEPFLQEELYLREEDKQFYFWNSANINPQEELIIDFDLKIGDTVGEFPTDTIERIETLLIGQEERKVFHTYFGRTIYEGIGTDQGLFTGLSFLGDEGFGILNCYSQNGENYLLHEGALPEEIAVPPCENLLTNIEEIEQSFFVKIFPNPVGDILYLDLNLVNVEPLAIEVHNLNGQQLLQKEVTTNHLIQLDISNLPKGLSVLSIKGKTFRQFIKFFKK